MGHNLESNDKRNEHLGLPQIDNFHDLAVQLGIRKKYLYAMTAKTPIFYRSFQIPKSKGGKRTINAPYPSLLSCQKWIANTLLHKANIHPAAYGFVTGKSVVSHARLHCGQKWLLKIDIADFFQSIGIPRVLEIFKKAGYSKNVAFLLARLCCLHDYLPQGAATSPQISNIIFRKADSRLKGLAESWAIKYSRYADDLAFSGSYIPSDLIITVYDIIEEEGFSPKKTKTQLIGPKGRKILTGISIQGVKPKIPRSTKRQLRQEIYHLRTKGFDTHIKHIKNADSIYIERLLGRLHFWKQVETDNQFVQQAIDDTRKIAKYIDQGETSKPLPCESG